MQTLILFSHQYFEKSKLNKALLEAANTLKNVKIRNLDELYGTNIKAFDIEEEQKYLQDAQKIVFQFPLFWFSTPPMLKAYQDEVLSTTIHKGKGEILANKEFHMAVSLGSKKDKYSTNGRNEYPLEDFLIPLFSMAKYCKMIPKDIFVSDDSYNLNDEKIASFQEEYKKFLS